MKIKRLFFFLFLLLFPFPIFAYSSKVAIGGDTIGIEVHSDGVYVVGFYSVDGNEIAKDAGFLVGDVILEINHKKMIDVSSFHDIIQESKNYTFTVLRGNQKKEIPLFVKLEHHMYQTGLYVKDQINGIGTLSYIDPETKVYGSLGHEILESSSFSKFLLKEGTIYKAEVSSIKKSVDGNTGEKNAIIDTNEEIGSINRNEIDGIFGIYTSDFSNMDLLDVGDKKEIRKGNAVIRTVLQDDFVEEFQINILSIDENDPIKNILFEITDSKLLRNSGGIVQGMSGSPIIQNHKIIGVVNYVIVDEAKRGYGIFIQTMLEEGDRLIS